MNRKLKHRLEYLVFQVLYQLTRLLPRRGLLAVGRGLGTFVWKVVGFRRQVILGNLTAAFGEEHDAAWIERTAHDFYRHLGMTLMEFLAAGHRSRQDLVDNIDVEGLEILDDLVAAGQAAVLVSGHFGNFELQLPRAAVQGIRAHGVVKAQSNRLIDGFYNGIRSREGVGIIYTGGAFPRILETLKSGEFVGLMSDQDAGPKGHFVKFMGRYASVTRGPATLAVQAGVPIVMAIVFRQPDNRHVIRIGPRIDIDPAWDEETAIRRMTERHTAALEEAIREAPAMYYWVHRRWKTRPPESADETEQ
jgi:KDO2-lipid IV(A) lauroyltransferase